MSSSSIHTRSLKDSDPAALKSNNVGANLENRLNYKDLEALQEAFEFKGNNYEEPLSLNKEQFVDALLLILNKGSSKEYEELFDKIDISKDGSVSWDKFASHMLLEFYEKDDRQKSTQLPQWKDLKKLSAPHKDMIQRFTFMKSSMKYLAVSKEGIISLWSQDLNLYRSVKTGNDTCKQRDLWVTDFAPLNHINKLAISFTSKEIAFYDMSSKMDFCCQYKLQNLSHIPLCMDYWSNPKDGNESVLLWGDVVGCINILLFNSANIALFERPLAPTTQEEKNEACLYIKLSDIIKNKYKTSKYMKHHGHSDWVRQVRYLANIECFLSCCTSDTNSMIIGFMDKNANKDSNNSKALKREDISREIKETSFQVMQGINAFDYHEGFNLIATAGVNHHVCLWNPYVVSKPNGILRGHMASVVQVQFNRLRSQLISFSKDKVLRIWDIQLQVCIQRLAGMFPKGPEVDSILYFHEDRSRLFITFNYNLTLLEMKPEIKDKIMSHEKPLVGVLYNSAQNQVISGCQGGNLVCWMIDTGQKIKTIPSTHGEAELTVMTQDQSETRIFTGGTDGFVKIWDYNGRCYHQLICAGNEPADVACIVILKRSIIAVGFSRAITVFRLNTFREFKVEPSDWKGGQEHQDDILTASFLPSHVLATASYDGEIVIWNTNSEVASKRMKQRCRLATQSERTSSVQSSARRKSGANRQPSFASSSENSTSMTADNETKFVISCLIFLNARKSWTNKSGANLVSCGGNGIVRFWNSSSCQLLREFVAHERVGSIIMNIDEANRYLVTGDVDGVIKVWIIQNYCINDELCSLNEMPQLHCQWSAHNDMINSLILCQRNQRDLILTASSDCSVKLWDVHGVKIGTFGQEMHWKIEPCSDDKWAEIETNKHRKYQAELSAQTESESRQINNQLTSSTEIEADDNSHWEPDDMAVEHPNKYRINTWDKSYLGKDYQENRVLKRARKQPSKIPDLPYLFSDKTGAPPFGPFNSLNITDFREVNKLEQPDFMDDPDKYFNEKENQSTVVDKLPALSEILNTAFDERSILPKYIADFESHTEKYWNKVLQTSPVYHPPATSGAASPVRRSGVFGTMPNTVESALGSKHSKHKASRHPTASVTSSNDIRY